MPEAFTKRFSESMVIRYAIKPIAVRILKKRKRIIRRPRPNAKSDKSEIQMYFMFERIKSGFPFGNRLNKKRPTSKTRITTQETLKAVFPFLKTMRHEGIKTDRMKVAKVGEESSMPVHSKVIKAIERGRV